jgi:hypothetical protein
MLALTENSHVFLVRRSGALRRKAVKKTEAVPG